MIEKSVVKKLANLAKLTYSDEKLTQFAHDLSSIHDMINQVIDLDCDDVEPLSSVCDMQLRTREDIVVVNNDRNQILSNAGDLNGYSVNDVKCYIVPKVVE